MVKRRCNKKEMLKGGDIFTARKANYVKHI